MTSRPGPESHRATGNIYFLTEDQRLAILWAIGLGLAHDDGFPFPRDQNRVILRSARDQLTFSRGQVPR